MKSFVREMRRAIIWGAPLREDTRRWLMHQISLEQSVPVLLIVQDLITLIQAFDPQPSPVNHVDAIARINSCLSLLGLDDSLNIPKIEKE